MKNKILFGIVLLSGLFAFVGCDAGQGPKDIQSPPPSVEPGDATPQDLVRWEQLKTRAYYLRIGDTVGEVYNVLGPADTKRINYDAVGKMYRGVGTSWFYKKYPDRDLGFLRDGFNAAVIVRFDEEEKVSYIYREPDYWP